MIRSLLDWLVPGKALRGIGRVDWWRDSPGCRVLSMTRRGVKRYPVADGWHPWPWGA